MITPLHSPSLTVLIATYNRANVLRETLDALVAVDQRGVNCNIVIIDNNCTDETAAVVSEYAQRLPIALLKELRPGKNCALNKALRETSLNDIVVFTDDDVTPARNWFHEIVESTKKWPEIAVFGGRVEIEWPEAQRPEWAVADWIRAFGYSWHHYSDGETVYEPPACPFGPNFWVRKKVFEKVPSYDETIGPRPTNRIMGSETSFLRKLQHYGIEMLYYPAAVVQHRIEAKECQIRALQRRGYRFGRGQVRLHGWHRHDLYQRSRTIWGVVLIADYCYTSLRFLIGCVSNDPRRNCETTVSAMIRFGQLRETTSEWWDSLKMPSRKPGPEREARCNP